MVKAYLDLVKNKMHQEDEEDYDDDEQDSHQNLGNPYKYYFKFDPDAWDAWGKMLYDALGDLVDKSSNTWYVYGWDPKKFPVNSSSSNAGKPDKGSQYLGVNYLKEPIFKSKYFVVDTIDISYRKHLEQHAVHFLQQPKYYQGLFDILN
jgi:hypothetical protein